MPGAYVAVEYVDQLVGEQQRVVVQTVAQTLPATVHVDVGEPVVVQWWVRRELSPSVCEVDVRYIEGGRKVISFC